MGHWHGYNCYIQAGAQFKSGLTHLIFRAWNCCKRIASCCCCWDERAAFCCWASTCAYCCLQKRSRESLAFVPLLISCPSCRGRTQTHSLGLMPTDLYNVCAKHSGTNHWMGPWKEIHEHNDLAQLSWTKFFSKLCNTAFLFLQIAYRLLKLAWLWWLHIYTHQPLPQHVKAYRGRLLPYQIISWQSWHMPPGHMNE